MLNADELKQLCCEYNDILNAGMDSGYAIAFEYQENDCVFIDNLAVAHRAAPEAHMPVEKQDALISRLVPQPLALFTTPVDTRAFEQLSVPKSVVFCNKDTSLPPGAYLRMAQSLGEHKLIEVEGGHETLFTQPEVVAAVLQECG